MRPRSHHPVPRHPLLAPLLMTLLLGGLLMAPPVSAEAASGRIGACTAAVDPRLSTMLAGRAEKPNVVLGVADLTRAKQLEAGTGPTTSSTTGMQVRQQLRLADESLSAPLPSTPTSLQARASFDRILRLQVAMALAEDGRSPALAAPSRTTPAATYAARVRKEVAAFVAMPTWGSTAPLKTGEDDMLDTAEVAAAVSLGYSAAASTMSATERGRTRQALVERALAPACWGWANGSWMVDSTHNWGVVVGAGTAMAAVVVADGDLEAGATALTQSLQRVNRSTRAGNADGGSAEGPSYAGLIHTYTTYLSATLEASFGRSGPSLLAGIPGTARYVNAVTGPSGQLLSHSDANTGRLVPVLPVWNARHGGDPLGDFLAQRVLAEGHPHPLLFLWARPTTATPVSQEPTALVLRTSGIATMRSGWASGDTFVGVKAGTNRSNHSHLDLGSVVLDANGRRFVGDPGQDCYCLRGYFDAPQRFGYWRIATAGHSTASIAGLRQQPTTASAPMGEVTTGAGRRTVAVNMTEAARARWAQRQVSLAGETVVVQDQFRTWGATTVRSALQTQAVVAVARDGRSATLTVDGQVVDVTLPSTTGGLLRVAAAPGAPSGGLSTAGWKTLYVDAPTAVVSGQHAVTVTVVLTPR